MTDRRLPARSSCAEIDAFVEKAAAMTPSAAGGRGRLIFAMDATASREPAWDRACQIQGQMFIETDTLGGLELQLVYYRGFGEFSTTGWLTDSAALAARMSRVRCAAGATQIVRVLRNALADHCRQRVNALVFIGDCMEEDIDRLGHLAGELGLHGLPVFVFHEGGEPVAERAFREVARLSGGAYCRFDAASPAQLRDLLSAVAVYAAGGRRALADFSRRHPGAAPQLSHQLKGS